MVLRGVGGREERSRGTGGSTLSIEVLFSPRGLLAGRAGSGKSASLISCRLLRADSTIWGLSQAAMKGLNTMSIPENIKIAINKLSES